MKRVEPIMVVILSIITFGIYALIWYVSTKDQMNANGAKIPSAWLIIVPIINFYWMWKFCEGIGIVTNKRMDGVIAFLLLALLGLIGMAIIQDSLNKVSGPPVQSYQTPAQTPPPTYSAPAPPPPPSAPPSNLPPPPPTSLR